MLHPVTAACDLLAINRRNGYVREPDLDELMRDPITLAVMAADRVDRSGLDALLAQLKESLR